MIFIFPKGTARPFHRRLSPTLSKIPTEANVNTTFTAAFLKERIIFLGTAIDDQISNVLIAQLLFLGIQNTGRDIKLYINSPGGSITAGLAIYDAMQFVKSDIETTCMGIAASMATVLLCAGTKGKRYALPNSYIHRHPALIAGNGMQGYAPDIAIQARFLASQHRKLREIMAHHTGQPLERVERDFDRDRFMTPQEALEYGLIDDIMAKADLLPELAEKKAE